MRNLLLLSVMQASLISSTIISSNCMVIGINPLRLFKRMREQWRESQDLMNDMRVTDSGSIPGLEAGAKYADLPEDL